MAAVPVVYLDTQDYSKFGDVLRGNGDPSLAAIFDELERRKLAGTVQFAASMPLLGELLQYTADYRETTFKKAEAVQRLCDGHALSYPSRLVAAEVAKVLRGATLNVLSDDWYWYPDISDIFDDLGQQMQETWEREVAGIQAPNRKLRRGLKKRAAKMDLRVLVREATPAIAAEYGLPEVAITGSIVAKLEGRVTSTQASRMLFGSIAEPSKFVETYFERMENDRSLPRWMPHAGRSLQEAFERMRETVRPLLSSPEKRESFREALSGNAKQFGATILSLAREDLREFDISEEEYRKLSTDLDAAWQVPSCRTAGLIIEAYVTQILGYAGPEARVEHSFGGDLVHALYLPHVDIWRGDRRFAALVRETLPALADRVVPSLKDLPSAIDAFHKQVGAA